MHSGQLRHACVVYKTASHKFNPIVQFLRQYGVGVSNYQPTWTEIETTFVTVFAFLSFF